MDQDRKYRQHGYMDSSRDRQVPNGGQRPEKPRAQGPRPPIDVTGPRLPRMVEAVVASRCFSCSTTLPSGVDFKGSCPKCNVPLHCCKQCAHFEPSTRFQCLKPVPLRIAYKDQVNECELFKPRVTVARDVSNQNTTVPVPPPVVAEPMRRPSDARAAFDSLFKKPLESGS
jgi:hypothetical protein